ncbi:MAG: WD40 repeat domain-containing protein, partial [Verrucomicrobiales bacterium]|nr:WD40 repeat domain-containing protein [Verrucomicrobiales bacterium]
AAAWAVITALAVWFVLGLRASEKKATTAEAVAVEKEAETSKALARSALSLARSATSLAEAALRESNGPAMRAALEDVPEDLRGSTWHYLFGQSDTSIARIDLGEDIRGVVAHPRLPSVFVFVTKTGKVALMNVRTGERLLEFSTPALSAGGNYDVAISPDGESIAIGQDKGGFEIHNGRNGQEIIAWESERAHHLAFSADGRLLLQTRGRVVNLWNTSNGELRWSHDAGGPVSEALLTPDGTQVLVRSKGRNSKLLNFEDGTLIRNLGYQPPWVSTFHPGGKTLLGGERDGVIKGFDFQNDRERFKFQTDGQEIQEIVVSASGARFISVAKLSDGRQAIRVWDTRTGSPLQSLLGGMGPVSDASVNPLSGELVVTGPDTRVWSLGTGARWHMRASESLRNQNNGIGFWKADELVFGPRSREETTLLPLDGSSLDSPLRPPKGNGFNVANVSSDGRFAAVAPGLTKSPVLLLRRNGDEVEKVGTFAATFSIENLRVSPSGNHIAIMMARKGIIDLIDTATGTQPVKLAGQKSNLFNNLAWLSEDYLLGLVTSGAHRGRADTEDQIVLWDITTGEILRRVTNSGTMDALTVAPDGRRFAEGGADKNVRIRDADTLAVLKEFRVHNGPVTALAWHPKKPILATCSADLSIRLWNLETGERIDELRGPTATPLALAFSPDGQRLGCASQDSIIRIWDPPSLRDETSSPPVGDDEVMDEDAWFAQSLPGAKLELKPDGDGWIDLLAALTPESVEETGEGWRFEKGELYSPTKRFATLPLPGELSGISYQVQLKLRRLRGDGFFHMVLPVGDRMTGFEMDGGSPGRGIATSLIRVNGKWGKDLPGFVNGRQINDTVPHDLEVTVRLDGINASVAVTLDAKPLYQWTGPTDVLSQAEVWAQATKPAFLALGTNNPSWVVSEVKVKRLDAPSH